MDCGDFGTVPKNCEPPNCHIVIRKLALLLESPISEHDVKRHLILLDELNLATCFGFYACDLPSLIRILHCLTIRLETTPQYNTKLEAILQKCLCPPLLRKASDLLDCSRHLQEYLSCLGYILFALYQQEKFYNVIFDVLHNLLIQTDNQFPPCCVSKQFSLSLLLATDLPRIIGELTAIAEGDCYKKVLQLADSFLDVCNDICIPLVEADIMDHILMKLVLGLDCFKNLQDSFDYQLIDDVGCISQFLVKILVALRRFPKEKTNHLKPPDVQAMWCFRYAFRLFVMRCANVGNKFYRNDFMSAILMWLERFEDFLFIHSGLADDVYLLCSSDLGVDEKDVWAANIKWTNESVDYRFKQMLLYVICLSIEDPTYAAVLQNYNVVPCLLHLLTPGEHIIWLPEQCNKLVKITLASLEKLLVVTVQDFIKYNGPVILHKILEYHKDDPKDSAMIFACCRLIATIQTLSIRNIIVKFIKAGILDTLMAIANGYLRKQFLIVEDKTSLSMVFCVMGKFYMHYMHCPDEINTLLLKYLLRVKKNSQEDFICDPKVLIAALDLLQETVLITPILLQEFAKLGGIFLLLDLLTVACYPVKTCILTIVVDLCEIQNMLPYLLTWRSNGKTLMHLILTIFREDIISIGANVDQNCVIQDVEKPLISKRQWEETIAKNKYTSFSPAIIDMMGNCKPKVYAILHLLKYKNAETADMLSEFYKIWTGELGIKDRIVLVLCENYMKIKIGESWVELQTDIEIAQFIPTAVDTHLVHLLTQHHYLWNQRLKRIQEKMLVEEQNHEFQQEVNFYQKIKNSKLILSLEALNELQYIAECSDSMFRRLRKLSHRLSLDNVEERVHKTYMAYFNVNCVCNQKVIIETDKLVESKKDWETDFSDLKVVSPVHSDECMVKSSDLWKHKQHMVMRSIAENLSDSDSESLI